MLGIPSGRLAPHETLELHELLAFHTICLTRRKSLVRKIADPALRQLYLQVIAFDEQCIQSLAGFLQTQLIPAEVGSQ